MNEYLSKLYDWISSQDTTFKDRRSKEEFMSKMENDADYNQQMYTWISGVDATFTDRYTPDAFQEKTGLKKKEGSEAISEEQPVVSATPAQEEPGLLASSQEQTTDNQIVEQEQPQPDTLKQLPAAPPRKGVRKNQDGSESTHLMATETFDGKNWFSFPTLFQDPDGTWIDMSDRPWEEAYEEAKKRGEVIDFGTDKEAAIKFGEGSWKMPLAGKTFEDFELAGVEQDIDQAKVLQSAGIDQKEFDEWRERTAREEGFLYSAFKNDRSIPLYGEDPDIFYGNREREQMKFIQSFKVKQINEIQQEIEQKQKTLSDPNISTYEQQRLYREIQMLQGKLSQEYRNFKQIEKNFPNYMRMKSEEALKKKELIDRTRKGGVDSFVAGATQIALASKEAIYAAPANLVGSLAVGLDALLSSVGFDKKGMLAAISEDISNEVERNLDQSEFVQRPAFIEGKEVIVDGIKYVVDGEGIVYDEQTLVPVNDLMPEDQIQSIVKESEKVEEQEVYTDLSAGIGAGASMLINLSGLIRGGQIVQKALGVGPKLGVGLWSTGQALSQEVNSLTEELIASGIGEKEAIGKARVYGGLIATLDGVWTGITGANDKLVPKKQAIKELLYDLVEKDAKNFTKQQIFKKGKELINENFKELVEEFGVLYSTKAINSLMNADLEQEIRNVDYGNKADIIETLVMTLGATNALGASRVFTNNDRKNMVRYVANNIEDVDATVKSLIDEGLISIEDGKAVADEIKRVREAELKVAGAIKETENMLTAAELIKTKERLIQVRENQDPALREDTDKKIASIDAQLKLLQEKDKKDVQDAIQKQKTRDISDAQPAEAVQEVEAEVRVSPEEKAETVGQLINRPVTLTKLGGSKLDAPIEGDMYLDGQQVVVEDANGNITEIGNVDEISGKTLEELGIEQQQPAITTTKDGNIEFEGETYNPDSARIRRDSRGNITSVTLDQVGKPRSKTFRGKNAEDAAYNVLLRQADQSTEIEQLLEQDEEFQNELRQAEAAAKTAADQDTRPPVTEKTKLQGLVDNAKKAIAKLGLNVEIIMPETEAEYMRLTNEEGRESDFGGKYINGKIYINPAKANSRTVAHEVFHALLLSRGMSDAQARAITERMLSAVKKSADADLLARLEEFSSQYPEALQSEESIAELFGILADGYPDLPAPTQNIIKRWLDKLAKILGLKPFTDAEVIDLLNTVSGKVARGEQITEADIKMFDDTGRAKTSAERKQIIGENAQLTEQVRQDLSAANEMERMGKDAETIKLATGWERGADKKWRYEIADNIPYLRDTISQINETFMEQGAERTLLGPVSAKLILPPELLELYPQLEEVTITFNRARPEGTGVYDIIDKTMDIGVGVYTSNTVRTLVHEVQHAIQAIEMFAAGGSARIADKYASKRTKEDLDREFLMKEKLETFSAIEGILEIVSTGIADGNIDEDISMNEIFSLDFLENDETIALYGLNDPATIRTVVDYLNNQEPEYKEILDEIKFNEGIDAAFEYAGDQQQDMMKEYDEKYSAFGIYKRLAGEVEARNVEKRMDMSEDLRRQKTLQETEDVAREDQIVLFKEFYDRLASEEKARTRGQKLTKTQKDEKPKAGNRLFNEPLKGVKEIADGYYKRVFKSERPKFEGTRELDKNLSKRISDSFEAMKHSPNDPEVKAAYQALADETLAQYQAFLDAGYIVEIDNVDAYANSQEMINDLRDNKRIKIFSTEAGFGKDPITAKQRKENPLLRDSGFKDTNGNKMLINDVFRAIHDFYGHAELGNGFGAKGEENAWNVHSRMFSPLARRAMTTETRGQNSYVNFSGVNEKVESLRDQARSLRDQGKESAAQKIVDQIYELTQFANQKIGLLPAEFSLIKSPEKVVPAKTDSNGNLAEPTKQSKKNLVQRGQKIVKDVKAQVKPSKTVSTSLPNENDIHSSNKYLVGISVLEKIARKDKQAQEQYIKIAREAASYGLTKTKLVNNFDDARKVVSEFKNAVKKNLRWLYDSVSPEIRNISKLWYDGANKISNELSTRYEYSLDQVAGVMAVLSPQMDWFRNLSLGERVIDIYSNQQDTIFDNKMVDFVMTKTTGTGKNKKPLFKDSKELVSRLKGKKLSQLSKNDQAIFVRVYDEIYNSREYNNITPNGEINGLVRIKSGLPGKVGWGDFSTIEKAISILDDGSIENISNRLGNQHKVRNFFNNISNPNDKNAVTIDTHAVAAALLKPLSGSSKEVAYNFGGSSARSTGMTGTYPVYADAYRDLAKDLGILPREVQSITWEAVRGLFKASFKSEKSNEQKINDVWNDYDSGKISLKQAQEKINNIAGGISKPVWYEYMADNVSESMDQNSAAVDQSLLDEEIPQQERGQKISSRPDTEVDRLRKESEENLKNRRKKKESRLLRLRKALLDRQAFIKRGLKGISGKEALKAARMIVVRAGAKGYAKLRYKKAEKEIFGGLSNPETQFLESLIYARRIISINKNRRARGMEPYFGKDKYGEAKALKDLQDLKDSIPEKQFNKINARADKYFGVFEENLKRLYDSGRINKETYDQLKDVEYTPIRTLKYLKLSEDELDAEIGMSAADIKTLSNENENDILFDAKWNLMTTINAVEAKAMENRMLVAFNKAFEGATDAEKEAMSEYMVDNPVIGKKKDGTNKRKFEKAEPGYKKVFFFENGVKDFMIIREDMANELLDVKKRDKLAEFLGKASGAQILRFFATGGNPLFIIGNTAVDFTNILFLSDVYSGFKPFGAAQLAWDFTKNFLKATTKAGNYNELHAEFMEYGGGMDYLSQEGLQALRSKYQKTKGQATNILLKIGEAMSFMGQSSEIAFRLAVYEKTKDNLIKQYKKENGKDPVGEDLEDIKYEAARESRETIDFSQGGTLSKRADLFMPYLNAGFQGYRKVVDYANKNPKGFASSMIQYAGMSAAIIAFSLANLISKLRDDDEEDKLADVLNSVSPYEKASYHIIFTGNKDEDGEYEYIRIKKLPGTGILATMAEQMIMSIADKNYKFDTEAAFNSARQGLPFDPTGLASRNPMVSAFISYGLNYDLFRNQEIFKSPERKVIEPRAEGLFDDRVAGLYKVLGEQFNLSPIRMQAFFEKFITSESTNPFVSLLYSSTEGLYDKDTSFGKEMQSNTSRFFENISRKLKRSTNKKLLQYDENKELKELEASLDTDTYIKERKIYKTINDMRKAKQKITFADIYKMVQENFDPINYKKYLKKYYLYAENPDLDRRVLDIVFEETPEVQAAKLYARYGDNFDNEEQVEIAKALRAVGRKSIGKKTLYIYYTKYKK